MALGHPKLSSPKASVQLVHTGDPDVRAKESSGLYAAGWIPRDKATITDAADVVSVRPLSRLELASAFDAGGANSSLVTMAQAGIVSVCGSKDPKVIGGWFESAPYDALVGLGAYVQDLTMAKDPALRQSLLYGSPDALPEGGETPSEDD